MILDVEDKHYEYLSIQHGSIASKENLANRGRWLAAYCSSIGTLYENIKPALPLEASSILDVGSGLGGIDIILSRHYKGAPGELDVCLLDGLDCPPYVHSHNLPFSNAKVAVDFHKKNGSTNVECCWPAPSPPRKFDIVVSFAAFAFHLMPCDHLPTIEASIHDKTCLIIDIRRSRPEWLKELVNAFGTPKVLHRAEKFVRCAFRAR